MARKNPRRNISRIETKSNAGKVYGGWEVRIQRRGEKTEKFFGDNRYDGKRHALAAAKAFRDEMEESSEKFSVQELAEIPSSRNKSGVVGVRLHKQKDTRGDYEYHYWYWVAQWTDANGRRKTKAFSIHQHGDQEAYNLACKARHAGVEKSGR
ncbi:AP2 domain-containing protein [bacterium]|nr:AP2 domain-containing protein [bacterium]